MGYSMKKYNLAIIWPGYRKYNQDFFEIIAKDARFIPNVLWICDFREDDLPPTELLSSIKWSVVGVDNFRISSYKLKTFVKMVYSVWKTVSHADVVLTSTQAPVHSKVAFFIAKILRKKIFIKIEQWTLFGEQSFLMRQYKKIDTFIMRRCDVLFPHGINQTHFAVAQGVDPSKVRVLPMLSDDLSKIPFNQPTLKEQLGLIDKKVILYFGRITPQKGLADLLVACSKIQNNLDDVILLICGGADRYFRDYSEALSYEDECRTLAEKLLPGKVLFVGPVNIADQQDYFTMADLFVHPHTDLGELTEGWGLVINEAASMSLPIICTDRVGSAPDLVVDGENGYIVPAGDTKQLAYRIRELLTDDEKRHHFADSSRRVFEKYHQPSQIPQKLWEAIHE